MYASVRARAAPGLLQRAQRLGRVRERRSGLVRGGENSSSARWRSLSERLPPPHWTVQNLISFSSYALMDYSGKFAIHTLAIYGIRFGHLAAWPLADLAEQMTGRQVDIAELSNQFAHVLQVELPAYSIGANEVG